MGSEPVAKGPFFQRGPIRSSQDFYGRSAETQTVLDLLSRMQNCSVTGPSRIGKTSFLLHLARPETWRGHGLDPDRHARVYMSCRELLSQSPEQIFHTLARATIEAIIAEPFTHTLQVPRGPFTLDDLRRFLFGLTRGGGRVVWFLDNLDLVTDNPQLDVTFFSALRVLASEPWLAMVIATQDSLHEMTLGDREVGSDLADLCAAVPLGPLTREEALAMMRDVSSRSGLDLEACWPRIEALIGRFPLGLKIACEVVLRTGRQPTEDNWAHIAASIREEVEPILVLKWMHLQSEEHDALIDLGQGRAAHGDWSPLHRIDDSWRVLREDGSWEFPCEAVRDFVLRRVRKSSAQRVESTAQAVRNFPTRYFDSDDAVPRVVRALARSAEAHHQWDKRYLAPRLAMWTAGELGCDNATIGQVRIAARLRDIGHIATPGLILHKPGPLTPEEWAVVRAHPAVGVQILDSLELPPLVKPAVRWHHEREDGTGYPDGLVACEIPLAARIVGVADAYAAMTSERPYRPAMSPADALDTLKASTNAYLELVVQALEKVVAREAGVSD